MINEADKDGDGKVSYEDFCNVMAVQQIKNDDAPENLSADYSTSDFESDPLEFSRTVPECTNKDSTGNRRFSFAAGAKRRMSCLLFGTPTMGKYSSSYLRPRSRSSCGNLAALHESDFSSHNEIPRSRKSFSASPSFLRDLFKKK